MQLSVKLLQQWILYHLSITFFSPIPIPYSHHPKTNLEVHGRLNGAVEKIIVLYQIAKSKKIEIINMK